MIAIDNYKVKILGVPYSNLFLKDALEQIFICLEHKIKFTVLFLNADCLFKAQNDGEYKEILKKAEFILPDGIGLRLAAKFLTSIRIKDNCNGTVLSPLLMKGAANKGYKIFFLGTKEGVAEKAAENIRKEIPGIRIVGTQHGYFRDSEEVIKKINESGADILFVAMGAPLQEKWIARNRASLNTRLCLGVGALFDYLSGQIPRAPRFMQVMHLEWLWRIFIEPRRMFRRYIIDGAKLGRAVFKYKLMKKLIFPVLVILCSYVSGCSYARVEKYSQLETFTSNKAEKKGKGLSSKAIKDFRGNNVRNEDIEIVKAKVEKYISLHKDLNEATKNRLRELTVTEGATKEEVELLLGKPTKIIVRPSSEMWVYKTRKTDPLPMLEVPVSFHQSYCLYFKENALVGIEMHYLKHTKFDKSEKMKQR